MEKLVIDIFAEQFGLEPSSITTDMRILADFNADSMDLVELVMQIEKKFDIEIEQEEYQKAETLAQVIELVRSKLPVANA